MSSMSVLVYDLVHCWEIVTSSCLSKIVIRIASCNLKEKERGMNDGCCLRYSTHKFSNNSCSDVGSNRVIGLYNSHSLLSDIYATIVKWNDTKKLQCNTCMKAITGELTISLI